MNKIHFVGLAAALLVTTAAGATLNHASTSQHRAERRVALSEISVATAADSRLVPADGIMGEVVVTAVTNGRPLGEIVVVAQRPR